MMTTAAVVVVSLVIKALVAAEALGLQIVEVNRNEVWVCQRCEREGYFVFADVEYINCDGRNVGFGADYDHDVIVSVDTNEIENVSLHKK